MTQKLKALSFLGYNPRGYSDTTYISADGEQRCTTKFFQEALVQFYQPDSLYILLTETAATGIPAGEEQSNWDTLKERLHQRVNLQPITNIPEKQTEADIWSLFETITACLEEGDRVIFDITHGFRSLPVLALIAVSYLRVVRNVTIEGLIYGAFNPQTPGETQIFDLLPIVSLLEWTTATDQFVKTGNGQQLANLLKQAIPANTELRDNPAARPIRTHFKKSAEAIEEISLALSLTRPIETMHLSTTLEDTLKQGQPSFEERAKPFSLLTDQVIQAYGQFALEQPTNQEALTTNLWLQLKMIHWYIQRDQIVQAVTLAREWIVSVLVLRFDKPMFDLHQGRKYAERAINNGVEVRKPNSRPITPSGCDKEFEALPKATELTKIWSQMTELRNDIAHVGMNTQPQQAFKLRQKVVQLYPQLEEIAQALL